MKQTQIYCGKCKGKIAIELWGSSKWWGYSEDFLLPHRNASHRCQHCKELWFSSDFVVEHENGFVFTR